MQLIKRTNILVPIKKTRKTLLSPETRQSGQMWMMTVVMSGPGSALSAVRMIQRPFHSDKWAKKGFRSWWPLVHFAPKTWALVNRKNPFSIRNSIKCGLFRSIGGYQINGTIKFPELISPKEPTWRGRQGHAWRRRWTYISWSVVNKVAKSVDTSEPPKNALKNANLSTASILGMGGVVIWNILLSLSPSLCSATFV